LFSSVDKDKEWFQLDSWVFGEDLLDRNFVWFEITYRILNVSGIDSVHIRFRVDGTEDDEIDEEMIYLDDIRVSSGRV
jgi:hypothetical protein